MMDASPPPKKPGPNTVAGAQARNALGKWTPGDDRRQLTEQQAAFAVAYAANGGNATAAAKLAGYSTDHSRTIGPRLLSLPWVQRAISIERAKLINELELAGIHVLLAVLRDPQEDKKLRVKAAEIAVKAGRADRDSAKDPAGTGKALSQMTVAELEALVRRLDQAAEAAKLPILEGELADNEQTPPAINPQAIDPAGESTAL